MSYPPYPPPQAGYPPPTAPPGYPAYPPPAPPLTKDKAKADLMAVFSQANINVKEVRRCSGPVELLKGYATYMYAHELSLLQSTAQSFIDKECKPNNVQEVYLWMTRETQYSYINVGFFQHPQGQDTPLTLVMLSIGTTVS
jgi:hypothetical protein